MDKMDLEQNSRESESYDPGIEAHAYSAESLRPHVPDKVETQRNPQRNARRQGKEQAAALEAIETQKVISDGGQRRFGHADQAKSGPKLVFPKTLIIEQ